MYVFLRKSKYSCNITAVEYKDKVKQTGYVHVKYLKMYFCTVLKCSKVGPAPWENQSLTSDTEQELNHWSHPTYLLCAWTRRMRKMENGIEIYMSELKMKQAMDLFTLLVI